MEAKIKYIRSTGFWRIRTDGCEAGNYATFPDSDMEMLIEYLYDGYYNWQKLNLAEHIAWFSDDMYDDYFEVLAWTIKNFRFNKQIMERVKHRKASSGYLDLVCRKPRIPWDELPWSKVEEERYQHNMKVALSRGRFDIYKDIVRDKARRTGQEVKSISQLQADFDEARK